ncbi:PLP-dependent transferase [Auricularia subglabra TFB-10046 SS5]|nr:PLP-dependent transferase [Auricularia subglabra TFB-10046 SS5]
MARINSNLNQPSTLQDMHESVSAWFLGPRAENFDLLQELFSYVLEDHKKTRLGYHQADGDFVTESIKASKTFQANVEDIRQVVAKLSHCLNEYSVPFFSPRYVGHMSFENSVPGIMGWIMTVLFNPNNVAFEASPFTTIVELKVGKQLCTMLGYYVKDSEEGVQPADENPDQQEAWGHIAADGTIANMESMWAARNLKLYPLALQDAMAKGAPLEFVADSFKVTTLLGDERLFKDLDSWELLNLSPHVILGLADDLHAQYGVSSDFLTQALHKYLAQSSGINTLLTSHNITLPPQYLVSSTRHYSWPKSAGLVGIGSDNCVYIPVDNNGRIDIDKLRTLLQERLDAKRAVYAVVAIIGSTEEGVVDPLDGVLTLRDDFAKKGLAFIVHADAAWGGYFASMIRDPPKGWGKGRWDDQEDDEESRDYVPSITLRDSSARQFTALADADSITIDPHKSGYIPYPAGGLCYKDGRMRFLLTWTAPYLHDSDDGESIGIYGIEGSKPGAPAIACYLHHTVVGLHKQGHGGLLGEVAFTCRRLSAHWAAMSDETTEFLVVPFNPLVHEDDEAELKKEKQFIRDHILGKPNEYIVQYPGALDEVCSLGSDLNINAFACNFRINGQVNDDVEEANYLNSRIFDRLSLTSVGEKPQDIPLFLSSTVFALADYGDCVINYRRRMGLETESNQGLFVLRNVVMSPFQAAGNYAQQIANLFQATLDEEVQIVVARNTITPQPHKFTLQGTDQLFLTYRPLFHLANSRSQLIITARFKNEQDRAQYQAAHSTSSTFWWKTADDTTLDALVESTTLVGDIGADNRDGTEQFIMRAELTDIKVLKYRSLASRWRDPEYPETFTPFYLYGTTSEQHVDHMLLCAPNAQISSELVKLNVQPSLTAVQLARGVIARLNRPERALQPFGTTNPPEAIFKPGAQFSIALFEDQNEATANGPGLANSTAQIATGTLQLGDAVSIDYGLINKQDFQADERVISVDSTKASRATKKDWAKAVDEYLAGVN